MRTSKKLICLFALAWLLIPALGFAQGSKQPGGTSKPQPSKPQPPKPQPAKPTAPPTETEEESDYTEEEYEVFQKTINEPDLVKRGDLLIKWLKEKHKTVTLNTYIISAYLGLFEEFQKQKNYQQLATAAEKFLREIPREQLKEMDQEAQKAKAQPYAENAYVIALGMAADAYQKLEKTKPFIEYGEKFYAEKPNVSTAYFLAKAYEKIKDTPKFIAWAEKTLQQSPSPDVALELTLELKSKAFEQGKLDQAAKYARQCLTLLSSAKKKEGVSDAEWKKFVEQNVTDCHAVLGEAAYSKNNLTEAIQHFEQALKSDKCKDGIHYRLGFAYWRKNPADIERAMLEFAKAERLNGRTSADAKKHLEDLYKSLHNNTLVGINKLHGRAEAELRGCKK